MRKLILLLFAALLIGCEASTSVQNTPGLVITAEAPANASALTRLTATLTPADPTARYHWDLIGFEYDTTAVIFHNFPMPGNYRVICYALSPDSTVLGIDTITVVVVAPNLTLNMQTLRTFEHIYIQFGGDHRSTHSDSNFSEEVSGQMISVWLDGSGNAWKWQNANLVHNYSRHELDTLTSIFPETYAQKDSVEHLDVTITGNKIAALTGSRSVLHKKFDETGKELEKYFTNTELSMSDLGLIHQSADSMVFVYMGGSVKDHVVAKSSYESVRLSTGRNERTVYDSTSWTGSAAPYTRVLFY